MGLEKLMPVLTIAEFVLVVTSGGLIGNGKFNIYAISADQFIHATLYGYSMINLILICSIFLKTPIEKKLRLLIVLFGAMMCLVTGIILLYSGRNHYLYRSVYFDRVIAAGSLTIIATALYLMDIAVLALSAGCILANLNSATLINHSFDKFVYASLYGHTMIALIELLGVFLAVPIENKLNVIITCCGGVMCLASGSLILYGLPSDFWRSNKTEMEAYETLGGHKTKTSFWRKDTNDYSKHRMALSGFLSVLLSAVYFFDSILHF